MKRSTHRAAPLLAGILIGFSSLVGTRESDRIALHGDILQYLLPATAAGLTLGYKDSDGGLEFGASAALTLGVNYGLKYSIDEKRPNGGRHSFPSGHSSISFSICRFLGRCVGRRRIQKWQGSGCHYLKILIEPFPWGMGIFRAWGGKHKARDYSHLKQTLLKRLEAFFG